MDESPQHSGGTFLEGLKTPLLWLAWLAALYAVTGIHPAMGHSFLLLSLLVVAVRSQYWRGLALLVFVFLAAPGIVVILVSLLSRPSVSQFQQLCGNNAKQISLALYYYKQEHGSFPPAYIADKNGKPMHSWRVLILPYLEEKPLYDAYRFDEPWDGPNNRKLAEKCPFFFRCLSTDKAAEGSLKNTDYVAVVGPHAAWTGNKCMKTEDFTDDESETILVVETLNSGIHWMEPRDLYVGQMARTVNPKAGQGISSKHTGGANVIFADGRMVFLEENLPPETLDALITRDGGEDVDLSKP